ncbi:uncharacterized protein V2V93DRAFT_364171 [Kockiozyma suomiensis]|uniref:uncharacterized protein n=1 Tax=Kockiozyma suomiensis TaxID=1337062 RepID=UPI0033435C52
MLAAPIMRDIPREHSSSRLAAIRSRLTNNNNSNNNNNNNNNSSSTSSAPASRRRVTKKRSQTAPTQPSESTGKPVVRRTASSVDGSSVPPPALSSSSTSTSSASSSVDSLTSLDPNLLLLLPGDSKAQADVFSQRNGRPNDIESKERKKDVRAFFTSFASRFGPLFASNAATGIYDENLSTAEENNLKKGSRNSASRGLNRSKKASSHVVVEDIVAAVALMPEPEVFSQTGSSNPTTSTMEFTPNSMSASTTTAYEEPIYHSLGGVVSPSEEIQSGIDIILHQSPLFGTESVPRDFTDISNDAYDALTFPHHESNAVYSSPTEALMSGEHSILSSSFDANMASLHQEFALLNSQRQQQSLIEEQQQHQMSPQLVAAQMSPLSVTSIASIGSPTESHMSSQSRKRSHEDFSEQQLHHNLTHMPSQLFQAHDWQQLQQMQQHQQHQQQHQPLQQQQHFQTMQLESTSESPIIQNSDYNSDREFKRRYASSATSRSPSASPAQFYMPLPAGTEADLLHSSSMPSTTFTQSSPPMLLHQRSMDTFLLRSAPSASRPTSRRQQNQQRLHRARSQPSLLRSSGPPPRPAFVNGPSAFTPALPQHYMVQSPPPDLQVGLGLSVAHSPLFPVAAPLQSSGSPPVADISASSSSSASTTPKKKRNEPSTGGVLFNNLTPMDHVKIMSSVAKSGSSKSKKNASKRK